MMKPVFLNFTVTMNELDKYAKPLPVDENVVVKLLEHKEFRVRQEILFNASQALFTSTKQIIDQVVNPFIQSLSPSNLFEKGIKIAMLEPGKPWITGKIRLRLVYEFIPDEPEIIEPATTDLFKSSLDDIRKTMK